MDVTAAHNGRGGAVPLPELCRPRTSLGCLFPEAEVAALRAWMASGTPGPALAAAGPGAGLTTLIQLLVRETGVDAVWIGCATPKIRALLAHTGNSPVSVTMRRKLIVIDEFDAFSSGPDATAVTDVLAYAKSKPPVAVLFATHTTRSQKTLEFAKGWPQFQLGRPSAARIERVLTAACAVAGIDDDAARDIDLAALARRVKGDVRAALMALDLSSRRRAVVAASSSSSVDTKAVVASSSVDTKDEASDALDLTEAVLRDQRGHDVAECLRMFFATESSVLSMGIFENYLASLKQQGDLAAVLDVSDSFSQADILDRYMYSRQAWDLHDIYGVFAVAGPSMGLHRRRTSRANPGLGVTKFGSVWSKAYNACAKIKGVRALATAYAEAGLAPRTVTDLGVVRLALRRALQDKAPDDVVKRWCHPLTAAQIMSLMRLSVGAEGSTWYKQSMHEFVKRVLLPSARTR